MRILLVEDDELLGDGIKAGLGLDHYAIDWVQDGVTADLALKTETYDLLILDLGLPKLSGQDVLKRLRALNTHLPVLVLTAKDTIEDRVTVLDFGADDYMIKPFNLDELQARIRALLRRSSGNPQPILQQGQVALNPITHHVTLGDEKVEISPREYAILHILMQNIDRVVSRARLEESLYDWDHSIGSNTVEVHIHHLRKKLGKDFIVTVRGWGYTIKAAL